MTHTQEPEGIDRKINNLYCAAVVRWWDGKKWNDESMTRNWRVLGRTWRNPRWGGPRKETESLSQGFHLTFFDRKSEKPVQINPTLSWLTSQPAVAQDTELQFANETQTQAERPRVIVLWKPDKWSWKKKRNEFTEVKGHQRWSAQGEDGWGHPWDRQRLRNFCRM